MLLILAKYIESWFWFHTLAPQNSHYDTDTQQALPKIIAPGEFYTLTFGNLEYISSSTSNKYIHTTQRKRRAHTHYQHGIKWITYISYKHTHNPSVNLDTHLQIKQKKSHECTMNTFKTAITRLLWLTDAHWTPAWRLLTLKTNMEISISEMHIHIYIHT